MLGRLRDFADIIIVSFQNTSHEKVLVHLIRKNYKLYIFIVGFNYLNCILLAISKQLSNFWMGLDAGTP
jgi:hypothetical protein